MEVKLKYRSIINAIAQGAIFISDKYTLMCVVCGSVAQSKTQSRCGKCESLGAIDAFYDLRNASILDGDVANTARFFDLLPIRKIGNLIDVGEGSTRCVHATKLGRLIGLENLFLKDETQNPTKSTKDRIASVGLSYYKENGIREFVVSSTGNSSTSYARAVQLNPEFTVRIFVGDDFAHRLNFSDSSNTPVYRVETDFVGASQIARDFALQENIHSEPGFFSLARREGLKTAYLEAFDQLPIAPKFVFQAISSGMGLLGAYKGALEYISMGRLSGLPRLIGCQQLSCAPMANAFAENVAEIQARHIIDRPSGIAEAILRGNPSQTFPYIRYITKDTGGAILAVSEQSIREAKLKLLEYEGIDVCYSAATSLATAIRMREEQQICADAPVLVNLTGGIRECGKQACQMISYTPNKVKS